MIEPKEHTVKQADGSDRVYILSKVPAVAGREIVAKYPLANVPKLGDYPASEEVMFKLMAYVQAVTKDGQTVPLTTRALIDNHVPDTMTLMRLEAAMLEYNFGFFVRALSSGFFGSFSQKAEQWITGTLTPLLEQLSRAAGQPSSSSKSDTP